MFDFICGIITLLSAPRMGITVLAVVAANAAILSLTGLWPWTGIAVGVVTLGGIVAGWRWESSAAKRKAGNIAGPPRSQSGKPWN